MYKEQNVAVIEMIQYGHFNGLGLQRPGARTIRKGTECYFTHYICNMNKVLLSTFKRKLQPDTVIRL